MVEAPDKEIRHFFEDCQWDFLKSPYHLRSDHDVHMSPGSNWCTFSERSCQFCTILGVEDPIARLRPFLDSFRLFLDMFQFPIKICVSWIFLWVRAASRATEISEK